MRKRNGKLIAHKTKGSVLEELDMSEQERLELKLKADLHRDLLKYAYYGIGKQVVFAGQIVFDASGNRSSLVRS